MHSYGQAHLRWIVTNRTGEIVTLSLNFSARGCQYTEQNAIKEFYTICTNYDFIKSVGLTVNVTDNEAYINDTAQGLINFWEPPLLVNATIYSGTIFLNGTKVDSLATTNGPMNWNLGEQVNESGTIISPPFLSYSIEPVLYASTPPSKLGWLNVSSLVEIRGTETSAIISPVGPSGYYDYYNGLALEFSVPSFPVVQTVCKQSSGQAVDCKLMNYSSTLGNLFRSGAGYFILNSTNIDLLPAQSGNSFGFYQYFPIIIAVAATVAAGALVLAYRRNHRDKSEKSLIPS
jgi:hypothetical protein